MPDAGCQTGKNPALEGSASPSLASQCAIAKSPTAGSKTAGSHTNRDVELPDGAICEYESLRPGIFDEDKTDQANDFDERDDDSIICSKARMKEERFDELQIK